MGLSGRKSVVCPVDQHCSQWARRYMSYCLCSTRDGFSFALGLASLICWGVAEIPQIITNCKKKSAEGLSFVFLFTWILGDLLNLFGCMLEHATLPTQYYTAVLYAITTFSLFAQAVYYGLIYPRMKSKKWRHEDCKVNEPMERRRERHNDVNAEKANNIEKWREAISSPIPFPSIAPPYNEEPYFMSARSLAVSRSPSQGSFQAAESPNTDIEQNWLKEPLLGDVRSTQSAPQLKIQTTLCVVSLMTLFFGFCNHKQAENEMIFNASKRSTVLLVGRKLFEVTNIGSAHNVLASESSGIGSILGWGMTAIYLGGRLPQICLNIRRGNVEGLNPLMFIFAVVGNTTYVASILVSSLEWSKIKPNLPWLVDAGGCVCLDIFILIQFVYFHRRPRRHVAKVVFQ